MKESDIKKHKVHGDNLLTVADVIRSGKTIIGEWSPHFVLPRAEKSINQKKEKTWERPS